MAPPRNIHRSLYPVLLAALLAGACMSTARERRTNVLEYLYPEGKSASPAALVQLQLPLNVGVVFVPETSHFDVALLPGEKQALLDRVKEAFAGTEGLGRIEIVPESFVVPKGGFENVKQIRSALGVELIALVSYDQTQFDDPNMASITYWTIAGAYVVPGNENETHTMVHVSVFDIASEALLLNASGQSVVERRATAVNLERSLREDRATGFGRAVDDMIDKLAVDVARFREQVKQGTVRGEGTPAVELTSSGSGGGGGIGAGGLGPLGLLLGLLLLLAAPPARRRA